MPIFIHKIRNANMTKTYLLTVEMMEAIKDLNDERTNIKIWYKNIKKKFSNYEIITQFQIVNSKNLLFH